MALPQNSNRSFPPPHFPWTLRQTWRDILFAHYRVAAPLLQLSLPQHMTLDTFEGSGWISIVAVRMTDFAPRFVPPVPWVSKFCQVNLRTYVVVDGKPGIYFFSCDASQPLIVRLARAAGLPYFDADIDMSISDESIFIQSVRETRGPTAAFAATYHPLEGGLRPTPGTLASWLTDRYCSFSLKKTLVLREDVHHGPWLLQPVRVEIHENSLFEPHGLGVADPPDLLHYARMQRTYAWLPGMAERIDDERKKRVISSASA